MTSTSTPVAISAAGQEPAIATATTATAASSPARQVRINGRDRDVARIDSITESAVTPSSSASGRRLTRCRSVGKASALTSSGETYSRPDSQAQARAVRRIAVAPRGDTPICSDGDSRVARTTSTMYASTCGCTITAPISRRARSRSSGPATGTSPAASRSRGSKPAACRFSTSISASRSGRSIRIFIRNRSSWASGSG